MPQHFLLTAAARSLSLGQVNRSCRTPLPIAAPNLGFRVPKGGAGRPAEVQPVGLAPVILAPRHLVCVLVRVDRARQTTGRARGRDRSDTRALAPDDRGSRKSR